MLQALYCYGIGILFMLNAVATDEVSLAVPDWIMAVYFIGMGSYVGWLSQKR